MKNFQYLFGDIPEGFQFTLKADKVSMVLISKLAMVGEISCEVR